MDDQSIDGFINKYDYRCWCGETNARLFSSGKSKSNKFIVLRCEKCNTQRILPRVISDQNEATSLYNSYNPPEVVMEDSRRGAIACMKRIEQTGQSFREGDHILDIGCGYGTLLEIISNKYQCYGHGIDTDHRRIDIAISNKSEFTTYEVGIFDAALCETKYDVVISCAVIEHVVDPIDFINQIKLVLKPGGSLYLLTPNSNSLNYYILRSWWRELLSIGEHIYLFTAQSLCLCVNSCGFSTEAVISDFDFTKPRIDIKSLRAVLLTGWSIHRELCKRICSIFSGQYRGDITTAHFKKINSIN